MQKKGNTNSKTGKYIHKYTNSNTEKYRYTNREAQTLQDKVSKDLDKSS